MSKEVFVCQKCRVVVPERSTCHPHYTILCESPVVVDETGCVIDCTQVAASKQHFKAAKALT